MALVNLGLEQGYNLIDRQKTKDLILRLKHGDSENQDDPSKLHTGIPGGIVVCENGEIDMRGVYCALVVADILNILDDSIKESISDFIVSCQTYEGGISSIPFGEAHAGYTYCGLASMIIIGEAH